MELTQRAAEEGARLIVAVGGDGTVHEAVNGLMRAEPEKRPELATIPRGTGKDFARSFRIPRDAEEALAVARDGATRTVDVGRAGFTAWDGAASESYFANFAGAGISGAVAARANTSSKALGGKASFFWATTGGLPPLGELRVRGHGRRRAAGRADARGDRRHRRPARAAACA